MIRRRSSPEDKQCGKCFRMKPLDDFPYCGRATDFAASVCYDCKREADLKRRREMLAEHRQAEVLQDMERMRQEMDRPKRFIDRKSRAAGERE